MNEKTRTQIEEMKKQTIGVEVEMYNITREQACKTIATYFHTEDTVRYLGGAYKAWSCKDNQGRTWKITRDSSIQAQHDDERTEMGTPILRYDDIEDLQEILRQLRHKGAKSDSAHMCGVHIHIGLDDHTPNSLRNLANIMASHESLLISALRLDRNRISNYCRTVADGKRKGGLHAGELKSYIQLCLALSQMAKTVKSASPKEPQVENPKYAMRTWLLRLGFIGEEFATAREILTRNLDGDTAFRHGRAA